MQPDFHTRFRHALGSATESCATRQPQVAHMCRYGEAREWEWPGVVHELVEGPAGELALQAQVGRFGILRAPCL